MEENIKKYQVEIERMACMIIKNGKLYFIKGEFKDEKGKSYSLEFTRWQVEFYLENNSEFTVQVKEVFKYFVKMAEVFNKKCLQQVYDTLEENDVEMFNILKQSISEVKAELFDQYL